MSGATNEANTADTFVTDLEGELADITEASRDVTERIDHLIKMSPLFDKEQLARLTVALKDAREAVSFAKTRLTAGRDAVHKIFVFKCAADDEVTYRTDHHTFSMGARGFFSPPNPSTKHEEFMELFTWLSAHGYDPHVVLLKKNGLTEVCDERDKNGLPRPPHVKDHVIASVTVRSRN